MVEQGGGQASWQEAFQPLQSGAQTPLQRFPLGDLKL